MMEEFLTPIEISRILKTSPEFVYRHAKELGGIKIGKLVRFSKSKFQAIVGVINNGDIQALKALFNHKEGIINPCDGIDPYPLRKKEKYIPPMEDVKKVLKVATKEQKDYLLTVIHTAGRIREINRLKPEDIDRDGNYVVLRTRKAKNSDEVERIVPVNKVLKEVLKKFPKDKEYIFTNKRTRTKYDYRDKLLARLCEKAKVRSFTFHCLRHLSASIMADAGVPITTIQKILGHQRATTTDIYLKSIHTHLEKGTNPLEVIK